MSSSFPLFGQSPPFAWSYDVPADSANAVSYCPLVPAGNGDDYLLSQIGLTTLPSRRQVHRIAADGTLLWRRRIEAPIGSWGTEHMCWLADGSLALAGSMYSNAGLYLHLDSNGVPIDAVMFQVGAQQLNAVQPMSDSTILLAGSGSYHGWHAVATADGTVLDAWWTEVAGENTYFSGAVPAASGGYLFHGFTNILPDGIRDVVIARTDPNAQVLWAHQLSRNADRYLPVGCMELPNGDILVCAQEHDVNPYDGSLIITRLGPTGLPLWSKKVTASGSGSNFAAGRMLPMQDSTALLIGKVQDPAAQLAVLRIDANGMVIGNSVLPIRSSRADACLTGGELHLSNVGLALNNRSVTTHLRLDSTLSWCASTSMALALDTATVGLDTTSTAVVNTSFVTTNVLALFSSTLDPPVVLDPCLSTGLPPRATEGSLPRCVPQPADHFVTILLPEMDNWSCTVHDLGGRILREQSTWSADRLELPTVDLPSGPYVVRLQSPRENRSLMTRLVVLH
ncbi:MAG: hypothetical protein IPO79_16515 [Flavobacteriales bacterium]|nr:hypothetical protein [Flavobacteriales bacterium]